MALIGTGGLGDPTALVEVVPVSPDVRQAREVRARGPISSILRTPGGIIGTVVVVGLAVIAIFGPEIAPYSFSHINVNATLPAPTLHHPLPTAHLHRHILSTPLS